jgi:hypothetical protein
MSYSYTNCSKCKESSEVIKITSNGYCSSCQRECARKWRESNRDKIKIHNANFNKNNPDKRKQANSDWRTRNIEYDKARQRKRYKDNLEYNKEYARNRYRTADKVHIREVIILYRKNNTEKLRKREADYRKRNNDNIVALRKKRRYSEMNALPSWLSNEDLDKIKLVYEKAKWLESVTGFKYDVDHVIPINGKNVCGFHIWENLQILERSLNRRKYNKY